MKYQKKRGDENRTPKNSIPSNEESYRTNQRYKNLSFDEQFKRLDFNFSQGCFTMKQVSILTKIDRANICRYISKRRKTKSIYLVKYGICPITKHSGVGFYTTNKELFHSLIQNNNGK
jgi:hypothetical protein